MHARTRHKTLARRERLLARRLGRPVSDCHAQSCRPRTVARPAEAVYFRETGFAFHRLPCRSKQMHAKTTDFREAADIEENLEGNQCRPYHRCRPSPSGLVSSDGNAAGGTSGGDCCRPPRRMPLPVVGSKP